MLVSFVYGILTCTWLLPNCFPSSILNGSPQTSVRYLVYRALNTVVDDFFVFLVELPTMHRMSVFRDDVVFLIYLWQSWLYGSRRDQLDKTSAPPVAAQADANENNVDESLLGKDGSADKGAKSSQTQSTSSTLSESASSSSTQSSSVLMSSLPSSDNNQYLRQRKTLPISSWYEGSLVEFTVVLLTISDWN